VSTQRPADWSLARLVVAARLFCTAGLLALAATVAQLHGLHAALLLCVTAAVATWLQTQTSVRITWVAAAEAAATGILIGTGLPSSAICLPYLLIPLLAAGCAGGVTAALWVSLTELLAVQGPLLVTGQRGPAGTLFVQLSPWLLTSLGIGLLGARLRAVGPVRRGQDASYESARRLIGQLRDVAGRLSSGLDAVGIAHQLLAEMRVNTSAECCALFVRNQDDSLLPLARVGARAAGASATRLDALAAQCVRDEEPLQHGVGLHLAGQRNEIAVPLSVDGRLIAVARAYGPTHQSPVALAELTRQLNQHSLRLDTSLAFDEVRSVAASDERRRVAAEIHDGIAQDAAALGYLVDDLAADAESVEQQVRLVGLRRELDRLGAELRMSIMDLRSDISSTVDLKTALTEHAGQVGTRSGMSVHLLLDETAHQLRPEVETGLFRIAQEAITNARKHSGATNLWVSCRVQPSGVRLDVDDDGHWSGGGRDDSYGLRIMRERAEHIGARLAVSQRLGGGTQVSVDVATLDPASPGGEVEDRHDYERAAGR
jgi:signal transduction histidine kinase